MRYLPCSLRVGGTGVQLCSHLTAPPGSSSLSSSPFLSVTFLSKPRSDGFQLPLLSAIRMWTSSQLAVVLFLCAGQAFAILLSAATDQHSCVPTSFLLAVPSH